MRAISQPAVSVAGWWPRTGRPTCHRSTCARRPRWRRRVESRLTTMWRDVRNLGPRNAWPQARAQSWCGVVDGCTAASPPPRPIGDGHQTTRGAPIARPADGGGHEAPGGAGGGAGTTGEPSSQEPRGGRMTTTRDVGGVALRPHGAVTNRPKTLRDARPGLRAIVLDGCGRRRARPRCSQRRCDEQRRWRPGITGATPTCNAG